MSVLARSAIRGAMAAEEDPLVITPILDPKQIGPASVDVRLGHEFIVWRRSALNCIDQGKKEESWERTLHKSQERIRVRTREQFVLHPGELVLGATLEYIALPRQLVASVEGRSSWGRLGLIIATATTVLPGFRGCLTLEIINSGEVPLIVYPGVRVAQLVFHRVEGESPKYDGKYNCPIGPEFTKRDLGPDARWWSR